MHEGGGVPQLDKYQDTYLAVNCVIICDSPSIACLFVKSRLQKVKLLNGNNQF